MTRLLPALLAVLLLFAAAPALHAHAVLLSASPPDGSLLPSAPASLRLTFNEGVRPLVLRLVAPDGTETDLTGAASGGVDLVVPLPALDHGTHVLSWRVVSADGHPIPGSLLFSVAEVTRGATGAVAADTPLRAALWLARFTLAAGLIIGVGGALFGWIAPLTARARRLLAAALVLGTVSAPVFLGLHGLDALGLGFDALASAAPWQAAAGTSFGPSLALAVLAGVLGLAGLWARPLAVSAALMLGLSYASSGHAGAAWPQALTRPMVALHLGALTVWIGALIPLALDLRGLRRFSALIPAVLIVLVGSGAGLAVIQLGPDPAHWQSAYGAILAAKLGVLAALLGLAAWNRWGLTPAAMAGDATAQSRMQRIIRAELALALIILALTAGWRLTPPPRALALVTPPPALAHLHSDAVMANLILTPGQAGPATLQIELTDADFAAIDALGVTLHLSLPDRGIEALARPATATDTPGLWTIPDLVLPLPGDWGVALDIRLSRFSQTRLEGMLRLPAP